MASYQDREAYIPYRQAELIELCLEDGHLNNEEKQKFKDFCSLLSAFYHFKFQAYLEHLKNNYAPFNPDTNLKSNKITKEDLPKMETKLIEDFKLVLERANYKPISQAALKDAFKNRSVIELKTKVDFDDFDQMVCYRRGDFKQTIEYKKFFRKKTKQIEVLDRVVLLIKFKDEEYFRKQDTDGGLLKFVPGKMYVYFYRNVPQYDLELLFPNIKISMTWKDRLKLIIPAFGAAIPVILKALPKLALLIGAISFLIFGSTSILGIEVSEENVRNFMPVLTALLSLVVVLGGYAFKQYSKYKSKLIEFRKKVTDTLFFKNQANNASVFYSLINAAEEEECKEIILVYYHLLTSKTPLTASELDDRIETWMDDKFKVKIDFDIKGPINNLKQTRGKVVYPYNNEADCPEISLLKQDERGNCHILSLDESKLLIDYIWDNIFHYT
ncbi:TMEM143 family protein [Myxosarcina sp. GI1]|uniref:TMEM143 family protein n=1 Tax=Myxosarcina sp. GI1 TaxID=1541065 RepID=UPI000564E063|nr:TMEM143 family protein [Myxosarcina sp. GI1]